MSDAQEQQAPEEVFDTGHELTLAMEAMEQAETPDGAEPSEVEEAAKLVEEPAEAVGEPGKSPEAPTEEPDKEEPAEAAEESKPEPEDERLALSWEKVMEKDRELVALKKQLSDQQKALEAHPKANPEVARLAQLAKSDPIAFLQQQGINYEQAFQRWTDAIASGKAPEPVAPNQSRGVDPDEIEQRVAQRIQQEMAQYAQQQKYQDWVNERDRVLEGDSYEPIRLLGAESEVEELTALYLREHNKLLSPKEAADMLLPEAKKKLEAIASKFRPADQQEQVAKPKAKSGPRTLGSDLERSSLPATDDDDEPGDIHAELRKAAALVD